MRTLLSALVASSLLLAACGGSGVTETSSTTTPSTSTSAPTTSTTTETPTTTPPIEVVFDWEDREATVSLAGGWTVAHCEGEAPLLCVARDGAVVGVVERLIADPHSYETYDWAADSGTNLRAIAAHFVEAFAADRAVGCGPDYTVEPIEPTSFDFGGADGLAYGFRGTAGDGTVSEYNLQYAALDHGRLILVVAAAYADGGCPGRDDMISFDPAVLAEFQPHLEALLGASSLPGGDAGSGLALPDGELFAWILAVEDGFVVDPARVLTGEEARLQATADGAIPAGEDVPNDVYIHNPTEDRISVRVADDATWRVIAPGTDGSLTERETDRETIGSILAGGDPGDIYGLTPEFMPFDLLVVDGVVVEATERYLP